MRFLTKLWAYSKLGKFFDGGGVAIIVGDVTLQTPTDGYTTADMTETFDCTDATNATLYRFQLASDAGFTVIVETGTSITSDYTSTGMVTGQTYFWRMRGENGLILGDWSGGWTIKTLGDITLDTPADASFTSDTTPTFTWFAASNATGYIFELATTNAFGASIIETYTGALTTFTATTVATDTWLYWHVRPTAEGGVEIGNNTATRSLELFAFRKCWSLATNDYGSKTSVSAFRNRSKWELCAWIYVSDVSANQAFFYSYNVALNRIYCVATDNAATGQWFPTFFINDATAQVNGGLHNYGAAYFIYMGFDGTAAAANRLKIYVNAATDWTLTGTPPTATLNVADHTLYIGSNQTTTAYFNGKLDHFAVRYDRALLSEANLTALYNSGNGRRFQEVATFDHIWEFEAATGSNVNDEIGALHIVPAAAPNQPTSDIF